jgi:hypothetical protein
MADVRLSSQEVSTIVAEARKVFGEHLVSVRLYGSRTDLAKSGGDIDLILELSRTAGDKYREAQELRRGLCARLGEQKFDLLVVSNNSRENTDRENTFLAVVFPTSKLLWSSDE